MLRPRTAAVASLFLIPMVAGGFFLGDYEGLDHAGRNFVPFFVMTNSGNLANRTDVFAARATAP